MVDVLVDEKQFEVRTGEHGMTAEILPDAPGHRRLDDPDMELLARATSLARAIAIHDWTPCS